MSMTTRSASLSRASALEGSPILQCSNLSARHGRMRVVEDVTLSLGSGEMLTILGPNGAGKSSLLGALAGLVSGRGEIMLNGKPLGTLRPHKRARHGLAFVPEQRGNIFPTLSVHENLEVGLRLLPPAERADQRDFITSLFPILRQRESAMAGVLSGGEQQMLAIGLSLGRKPSVLILDEPSQGLAPAVFDILEQAFSVLKRAGLALLMAEQNVPFAARIADRYLILSQGRVVQEGGKQDLADPDAISDAFLGVDAPSETQAVIKATSNKPQQRGETL